MADAEADPASIADQLSGAQQRRILLLARSQKLLPWTRTDDALEARGLVRRSHDGDGKLFAEICPQGHGVASAL